MPVNIFLILHNFHLASLGVIQGTAKNPWCHNQTDVLSSSVNADNLCETSSVGCISVDFAIHLSELLYSYVALNLLLGPTQVSS